MEKTNPMRILDRAKVDYVVHDYSSTGSVAATDVATVLGEDPKEVFKTLVTQGKSERYYVFVVPSDKELDLKKAAASVGEKSVQMIPSKELQPTTGYIHGGCSPLGMRKQLRTVVDISAKDCKRFYVSGGKVGLQIEMDFNDLEKVLDYRLEDIVR
ncbi:MAG: Cys-tRNA(Pro) deacylase [Candidatus Methanomethylophilus sp.]|nr:Cys-tRNA(Pro) deacylase [Methanomethylophilus sp.]